MGSANAPKTIRAIISGDNSKGLDQFQTFLEKDRNIKVVGRSFTVEGTIQLIQRAHPDMLVLALTKSSEKNPEWRAFKKNYSDSVKSIVNLTEDLTH
jgi:hypothetical protein